MQITWKKNLLIKILWRRKRKIRFIYKAKNSLDIVHLKLNNREFYRKNLINKFFFQVICIVFIINNKYFYKWIFFPVQAFGHHSTFLVVVAKAVEGAAAVWPPLLPVSWIETKWIKLIELENNCNCSVTVEITLFCNKLLD